MADEDSTQDEPTTDPPTYETWMDVIGRTLSYRHIKSYGEHASSTTVDPEPDQPEQPEQPEDETLTKWARAWIAQTLDNQANRLRALQDALNSVEVRMDARCAANARGIEVLTENIGQLQMGANTRFAMMDQRMDGLSERLEDAIMAGADSIERSIRIDYKLGNFFDNLKGAGLADIGRRLDALENKGHGPIISDILRTIEGLTTQLTSLQEDMDEVAERVNPGFKSAMVEAAKREVSDVLTPEQALGLPSFPSRNDLILKIVNVLRSRQNTWSISYARDVATDILDSLPIGLWS